MRIEECYTLQEFIDAVCILQNVARYRNSRTLIVYSRISHLSGAHIHCVYFQEYCTLQDLTDTLWMSVRQTDTVCKVNNVARYRN